MPKAAVQDKPAEGQTIQDEDGNEAPYPADTRLMATGYDANGEAVDQEVDTRPNTQAGLPGVESNREVELFEGRPVTAWKYSFTGNSPVSMMNDAAVEMFNGMRVEKEFIALVTVVPGSVSYKPNTEDGHVVGFTRERKLHITHMFPKDSDGAALFEGGVMRVRQPEGDGNVGYLTTDPATSDDDAESEENDLASALNAALSDPEPSQHEASLLEAGMCGKRHNGHLSPCRVARHACELPEADGE